MDDVRRTRLILTRKTGQFITIGDDVIVKFRVLDNGRVSVAIEAPITTKVMRGELQEKQGTWLETTKT